MLIYDEKGVKAELIEGDLVLTYGDVGSEISVKIKLDYLLLKVSEIIPGQIDDVIIQTLISTLKTVSKK